MRAERAAQIEEAIWEKMHFAAHLRQERLGEFTIGTDLHRSDSLAVVQLLILYHLVTARAVVAVAGGGSARDFDLSTLDGLMRGQVAPLRDPTRSPSPTVCADGPSGSPSYA